MYTHKHVSTYRCRYICVCVDNTHICMLKKKLLRYACLSIYRNSSILNLGFSDLLLSFNIG